MPHFEHENRALTVTLVTLATLVLLLSVSLFLPVEIAADHRKKVLILNSYSPEYKWTEDILKGIAEATGETPDKVSLQSEFMGTKRVFDPEYFRLLFETYRHKYSGSRFDAIIATDDDAINFLLSYRDQLFPGTPVIFCGANQFQPSRLGGARLFTGVNESADIKATLDLALKLHPKTRRIVIINDTTTTGRAVHTRIEELLPEYRDRVQLVLLEQVAMPEIIATLKKLPGDALVYFTFFFKDSAGTAFDFDESISRIAQASPVPVYGSWDFNLGYGMVGGMMISGFYQGKTAGSMAMRVLRGEDISRIPVVMQSPNRYMFDYRQLQRFDIKLSELPKESIIVNRPIDFYRVHRPTIWILAAAVGGLLFSVLLLLRNASIKRETSQKLLRLAEELEERVQQRTRELEKSQAVLERQNSELQKTYQELKEESEDRIRMVEELRLKDQLLLQQSRMAAMGEMLGNIAHQWRQPLNLVGLKVQEIGLACKLGRFSEELLNENVSKAMEILLHLSKTIDDLRMLSAPDKKKVPFMVDEVIAKTVSLIEGSLKELEITLETEIEGELQVEGFPNEYAQVLLNILMNSRDAFLERGTAKRRIKVRAFREDGRSQVIISDNAGGIPEAIIGKVFDPYFTTKELGKGTGIGLFMSKTIIEKNMGGSLTVRNAGEGAEFRISV